jgi:hypothetical protein
MGHHGSVKCILPTSSQPLCLDLALTCHDVREDRHDAPVAVAMAARHEPNLRAYVRLEGCSSVACAQLDHVGHTPSRQ